MRGSPPRTALCASTMLTIRWWGWVADMKPDREKKEGRKPRVRGEALGTLKAAMDKPSRSPWVPSRRGW